MGQFDDIFNESKEYITPMIEESMKDFKPTKLKTYEQEFATRETQAKKNLNEIGKRIQHAVELLRAHGAEVEIENADDVYERIHDVEGLLESQINGATMQSTFGFSDADLKKYYGIGLEMYNAENFHDASDIFFFLTLLNGKVAPFWVALGSSEWMKKDMESAMIAYMCALYMDEEQFEAQLKVGECMIVLDQNEEAKEVLNELIEAAETNEKAKPFAKQAKEFLKQMR